MTQPRRPEPSVRRSIALAFAQRHLALLVRLIALAIVSRLINPHELGIFLIAQGLVTLGLMFADFGIQQYIVAAPGTSRTYERRALAATLLMTACAMSIMLASAWWLPPSLLDGTVRTSIIILLVASLATPFVSVSKAVMQRDLRYGELLWVNLAATAAGAVATIALAWYGYGWLSLVLGAALETVVTAILALSRQLPPLPSFTELRPVIAFGGTVTAIHSIRQAGETALPLQVEAGLGLAAVGLLGRAQGMLMLFDKLLLDTLSHVVLPAFSQRRRDGGDLSALHSSMTVHTAVTAWPFFALLALQAPEIVAVMLGPNWRDTVLPLQILCLSGLFLPFHAFLVPYLIAAGDAKRFIPWQSGIQISRIALVSIAAFFSLECVCAVLVIERAALALAAQKLSAEALSAELTRNLLKSALVSVIAVSPAFLLALHVRGETNPLGAITMCTAAAAMSWLAALWAVRHPLHHEIKLVGSWMNSMLPSR